MDMYHHLHEVYTKIGYKVMLTSSVNRTGIDEIRSLLTDKTTLISGQSGVGKSTLVNAIEPNLNLRT